jgi:hypothetical protein
VDVNFPSKYSAMQLYGKVPKDLILPKKMMHTGKNSKDQNPPKSL